MTLTTRTAAAPETIAATLRLVAEAEPARLTQLTAAAGARLEALRTQHAAAWRDLIPRIRATAAFARFHEDPFTSHAYSRPRGYPGDADLLDFIYRPDADRLRHTSEAGLAIFRAMTVAAAPTAVRRRQALVAGRVDAAALELRRPLRIASLGCGHLAEAEKMACLETGAVERFWALDHDPRSLAEVERRFSVPAITGVRASVREFLHGQAGDARDLDVIYAAGLFDYLPDRAARRLVGRMFDRLRPGGRMLIANFATGIPDRAYMEAVMDWWLLYRTVDDVAALDAAIDRRRIAAKRTFLDPGGHIAYLELRRT